MRKSPLPRRQAPLKRSPVKRVNRARKAREFARCYHSKERVDFVKSLPCAACGIIGFSQNAHVGGVEGMGRKGSYLTIAPLCGFRIVPHPQTHGDASIGKRTEGCHWAWDCRASFRQEHGAKVAHAALDTESKWQAIQRENWL